MAEMKFPSSTRRVRSKYGAVKTQVDGRVFDSKREAARYVELKLLEDNGHISDLKMQQSFELIPAKRAPSGKLERATKYIADFTYTDHLGKSIVEDVKSPASRTAEYIVKRKLMLHVYGIEIREVM